jgi:hypothetical protein
MDLSILILVIAVAAVAYFVWNQRKGSRGPTATGAPPVPAPAPMASATPARPAPAAPAGAGPLDSYDEYRRANPSHMVYNKLTCNRCGSNRIAVAGGTALCSNCGAALYRA